MTKLRPNDPCYCGSGRKYKHCHGPKDRMAELGASKQRSELRSRVRPPTAAEQIRAGVISPMRHVPEAIPRPDYAETGRPSRRDSAPMIKDAEAIAGMRRACRCAREVLDITLAAVRPGITTDELDAIAHAAAVERGAYPSPLNYHHFPKSICTSVNEVICHGIPDDRALVEGDIVNCDITVYLDGFHGDCSETIAVGAIDEVSGELIQVTYDCLMKGIDTVKPGSQVRDIGRAIEKHATAAGFSVVRAFVGHGIGPVFHMEPQVPHYFDAGARFTFKPGMTFTIEPMINVGTWQHETWDDRWTAVTGDRLRSAQFEHTLLVTDTGTEILTARLTD